MREDAMVVVLGLCVSGAFVGGGWWMVGRVRCSRVKKIHFCLAFFPILVNFLRKILAQPIVVNTHL
jgi:uncharacterized membrane protein